MMSVQQTTSHLLPYGHTLINLRTPHNTGFGNAPLANSSSTVTWYTAHDYYVISGEQTQVCRDWSSKVQESFWRLKIWSRGASGPEERRFPGQIKWRYLYYVTLILGEILTHIYYNGQCLRWARNTGQSSQSYPFSIKLFDAENNRFLLNLWIKLFFFFFF